MDNIRQYEIKEWCENNGRFARITDLIFDIDKAMKIVKEFQYQPLSKDRQSKYKAVGCQYQDPNDMYYDSVESIRYINDKHKSVIETQTYHGWTRWNELGEKLKFLRPPQELFRTRILLAEKNGYNSVRHIDYDWRYHIPLTTNDQCFMKFDDMKCHFPADGYAYIVNAGFMHSFHNGGDTDRYHYCGIIDYPCKGDGLYDTVFQSK